MRPNGILIVVALVLGFAGGYFLRAAPDAAPLPPADATDVSSEPAAPTAEPEMLAPVTAPAPTQPTLESVRGGGVIRGRITDKGGNPIADVVVVAAPRVTGSARAPNPTRAAPPEATLAEEVADAVQTVRARHAGRQRVLSDASGVYEFKRLASQAHRIEAWKAHYQIRPARGSPAWEAKPGAVVDFQGEAILVLHLDVIGADGRPAEKANISSSTDEEGREGRRRFSWAPERNWVQLSPGEQWLVADVRSGEEKSKPVHVSMVPGEPAPRLTLELVGRPGIRGRVIYPEPMTPARPEVSALRFDGDTPPDATAAMQSRQRARGHVDRRDNTYSIRNIEAGRYLLLVSYDGNSVEHSVVVDVGNSVLERDIEMPPVDPSRDRVVRVLDELGKPIPDISFSLQVTGKSMSMGAGASTVQRKDGSYYVGRRPLAPNPRGTARPDDDTLTTRLDIRVRGRGKISRIVDPDEKGPLEIRFGAAASVDLLVDGFERGGLQGKCVIYFKTHLDESGMGFEGEGVPVTNEGRASIDELSAGEHLAVLVAAGPSGRVQVEVWRLDLDPGRNERRVTLPALYEATFVDSPGNPSVQRVSAGITWTHQFLRKSVDGVYTAHLMPPGRYIATTHSRAGKVKRVEFDVPSRGAISLGD